MATPSKSKNQEAPDSSVRDDDVEGAESLGPGPSVPKRRKEYQDSPAYLSFGTGLRLVNLYLLAQEFRDVGLNGPGIKALCRALKVPILHIQNTHLVDFTVFALALKSALMQGSPDFVVDCLDPHARPNRAPQDCRWVSEISESVIRDHLPDIMQQLLAGREISALTNKENFKTVKQALSEAACRIRSARETDVPTT